MPTAVSETHYEILGQRVALPCYVRNARAMSVVYLVPSQVAATLLGESLEPVEVEPCRAQLVLGGMDYLDNDLGRYREVMVVFFVRPRRPWLGAEGTYIYRLPVDEEFTCVAGRTIWGFPKTVEKIDFEVDDNRAYCRLVMDGLHAFTLSVPRIGGVSGSTPETEMLTYTYRPRLHAVSFASAGERVWMFPGGQGVSLELGVHPLATELRALGLPSVPLIATWTEHFTGRFGAPVLVPTASS